MKIKYTILFIGFLIFSISFKAQIRIPSKYTSSTFTFQKVNAEDVLSDFHKTTKREIHPRLIYSQKTIDRIKSYLHKEDPFVMMYYNNAKKNADSMLKEPLFSYSLDAANLRIPSIHQFAGQAPWLIFMYQMTGEKKYAEKCYQQFEALSKYPDWGADRHFLDTGIGSFVFAFVYDGLYNYLSPQQRKSMENAFVAHALEPGKYQIENGKGVWKWYIANHNWNGICNGGLLMGSLAMFERNTIRASELIADAINGLPYYFAAFEPDGQSEEGLMYWSYGLMYTVLALESSQNLLGTTYSLTDFHGFKKTGWFPFLMSGPVVSLNIGDDPLRNGLDGSFFWFAKFYNDAALARQHYNLCMLKKTCHWEDIYFYNPNLLKENKKVQMPLDNYIHGIELYSLRENWNSKEAMYIAMHGGANNANHGHLDAGSFYIQALGEVFAYGDLGSDNYTFPGYFSSATSPDYRDSVTNQKVPGRWHFYRLRTEGKNCIVINPTIRPEQKLSGKAKLFSKQSEPDGSLSSYTMDLTDCYDRDVTKYYRSIAMDRTKRIMTVSDHVCCKEANSTIWWFMHTKADIELGKNGKEAILTVNHKKMKAVITSPTGASFVILPATYLNPNSFPLTINSKNEGFKKLSIELKSMKDVDLTVTMVPM